MVWTTSAFATAPINFAGQALFAAGQGPQNMTADLDGDGKLDIVATIPGSNLVSILPGNGGPGNLAFKPRIDLAVGGNPTCVSIADFDLDGKRDIAACDGAGSMAVLRNTSSVGSISFAAALNVGTMPGPTWAAAGDIDGDMKPDIVYCSFLGVPGASATVLRNTSTGTTISFAAGVNFGVVNEPQTVAIADLNLDGKLDVVVANKGIAGSLSVLRNNSTPGNPSLLPQVAFNVPISPQTIAVADFDGDGWPDLATAAANPGSNGPIAVLRSMTTLIGGAISYAPYQTISSGGFATDLAAADLDRDGRVDLAVTNNSPGTESVLRNTSLPGIISFATHVDFGNQIAAARGVTIADIDGDGSPDLTISANAGIWILRNATPLSCMDKPPLLNAWWPLDETSGTVVANQLGAPSGTYTGSIGHPLGQVAGGVHITNSTQFVTVTDAPALNFSTGSFSVDAWVKTSDPSAAVRVIVDKRAGGRGYELYLFNGRLGFQIADGTSQNFGAPTGTLTDGNWHFVAATVNRSLGTVGGTLYVDGAAVLTFDPTAHTGSVTNTGALRMGLAFDGTSSLTNGDIDEVELFARALTPSEVASLYGAGGLGKCKSWTITASAGGGGSISPSGVTQVANLANQTYAITPATCFQVATLIVNGASVTPATSYTFTTVVSNHTISATFSPLVYTITASAGVHGSINPSGPVSVNCGANRTFTITPANCYQIATLSVDNNPVPATTNYTFTSVQSNHTIAATFSQKTFTVTLSAGPGGVSPAGESLPVACGGNLGVLGFVANPCYHQTDLRLDGVSLWPATTYSMSNVQADHTLSATFAPDVSTSFSDEVFNNADWAFTFVPVGCACGVANGYQVVTGGNPGEYRFALTQPGNGSGPSSAFGFNIKTAAVYDPASQGAITAITYDEDAIDLPPINIPGQNTGPALLQNGTHYYYDPLRLFLLSSWTHLHLSAVQASDFRTVADANAHPDFSSAGAPITFGYVRDIASSGGAFTETGGIDNWAITVNPPPTITATAGALGTIVPSGEVPVPCATNPTFTIQPDGCSLIADVVVDGNSVGAVGSYTFTGVTGGHTIAASFYVNTTPPAAVTALAAPQVKTANDADGTTKITLTFSPPPGAASIEVWRAGFGSYPTYDNGGGAAPALPGAYPPAGWTLTAVSASGQTDEPGTRDYWYYIAYAKDACGNVSAVSAMTGGVLGYHLGDVTDGLTPGQGDNTVANADVTLLSTHYGLTGAALAGFEYLDVGPTLDHSPNMRPTTDSKTDFEDLVMFAINFAPTVSLVAKNGGVRTQSGDLLALSGPEAVNVGDTFDVPVVLSGVGDLMALSTVLGWNPGIVEPIGVTAGDLVTSQGGVVMSPGPGRADAALLGAASGLTGQGTVATIRFHAIASGAPRVLIAQADGRDAQNQSTPVQVSNPLAVDSRVTATDLMPVISNPAHGHAALQYSMVARGAVDLSIYSVDGRRVKTLVHGVQEAGRYTTNWNGTDERGASVTSGVYFVRLDAPAFQKTRIVNLVR